jgi:hypothetical protein
LEERRGYFVVLRVGFFLMRRECLFGRGETLDEFHLGGMVCGEGACAGLARVVWGMWERLTFVDLAESLAAELADDGTEDSVGDEAAVEGGVAVLHEGVHGEG